MHLPQHIAWWWWWFHNGGKSYHLYQWEEHPSIYKIAKRILACICILFHAVALNTLLDLECDHLNETIQYTVAFSIIAVGLKRWIKLQFLNKMSIHTFFGNTAHSIKTQIFTINCFKFFLCFDLSIHPSISSTFSVVLRIWSAVNCLFNFLQVCFNQSGKYWF